MAAFAASFSSSSHALLGLGFNERKQKQQPRNWGASRLSVHNSSSASLPNNNDDHPAVLRNDFNGVADNPLTELHRNREEEEEEEEGGRSQLLRNLSEANQYIRTLQHELLQKEDALQNTRRDLSAVDNELQTRELPERPIESSIGFIFQRVHLFCKLGDLVLHAYISQLPPLSVMTQVLANITQEISRQGIKPGTRKINGRYIHSHLVSRLRGMQKTLEDRLKSFYHVQSRSIDLVYYGMAEDVQVMGSFDGWTRGDQMSPESTGTFTKFTTTIKLRPGRYEIKFLVDGEWHLSPDLPTVGEGLTMNNLLVVDLF